MPRVTVEFFTGKSGKSPVEDFIDQCQEKTQVKILRQLKYLQEFGLTGSIPNCKKLAGTPLWELRILGRNNIRLLFASAGKGVVMVLHAFSKKSQKTPTKELNLAMKRYQEMIDK